MSAELQVDLIEVIRRCRHGGHGAGISPWPHLQQFIDYVRCANSLIIPPMIYLVDIRRGEESHPTYLHRK